MFRRRPPLYRKSVLKGSVCKKLSQHHLNRPRDPPSAALTRPSDLASTIPARSVLGLEVVERCARDRLPAGIPPWLPW
jgi:hypothetical protein